jgi:hypothetical protein
VESLAAATIAVYTVSSDSLSAPASAITFLAVSAKLGPARVMIRCSYPTGAPRLSPIGVGG